jgi:hypothetical protein
MLVTSGSIGATTRETDNDSGNLKETLGSGLYFSEWNKSQPQAKGRR